MEKKEKNKEEILKFLRRGDKPVTEISIYTGINYYKLKDLLSELLKEEKIELFKFRKNKYYKLKDEAKHS